ncbi:hypothetical protein HN011_003818, partial [Eciton burchellii]
IQKIVFDQRLVHDRDSLIDAIGLEDLDETTLETICVRPPDATFTGCSDRIRSYLCTRVIAPAQWRDYGDAIPVRYAEQEDDGHIRDQGYVEKNPTHGFPFLWPSDHPLCPLWECRSLRRVVPRASFTTFAGDVRMVLMPTQPLGETTGTISEDYGVRTPPRDERRRSRE